MILGDSGEERCSGLFGSVRVRDARVGAVSGSFCRKFSVARRKKRKSSVLLEIVGIGGSILHNLVMVLAVFGALDRTCWSVGHTERTRRGEGWACGTGGSLRVGFYRAQVYYSWIRRSGAWPRGS